MKLFLQPFFCAPLHLPRTIPPPPKPRQPVRPDDVKFEVKTMTGSHPTVSPEAGKALIYFVSLASQAEPCNGCNTTSRVGLDGTWKGAVKGNSYLTVNVAPGQHHLCTNLQSRFSYVRKYVALANFTAEAGKVYYFRIRALGNEAQGFMDLDLVSNDEGQYLVASSRMSESHPQKTGHAQDGDQ
jgi:hypothetical protein